MYVASCSRFVSFLNTWSTYVVQTWSSISTFTWWYLMVK